MPKRVNKTEKPKNILLLSVHINDLRKRYGLSQVDFAKILNTCSPNISSMERGQHIPGPTLLCRTVLAFGISADWLLGVSDTDINERSLISAEENILKEKGKGSAFLRTLRWYKNYEKRNALLDLPTRRDIIAYTTIANYVHENKKTEIAAQIRPMFNLELLLQNGYGENVISGEEEA